MKAHLAFNYDGINHKYQHPFWELAVANLGWQESPLEEADFIVMWGPNPEFDATRARGKPVLMIDFPYWNRGDKKRDGLEYYKISLNGQHPTPYIMKEDHTPDRYLSTNGPKIQPWRDGGELIMLAGIGIKAAKQFGYEPGQWEENMFRIIRAQTDMPVVYRPKPRQACKLIPGTIHDDGKAPIEVALEKAALVVCHHGNPTVTALAMGIPIFMNGPIGAASHYASFDMARIDQPVKPENREKFFYNIAHWQWSVEEIKSGVALKSYFDRGFLG